MNHSLAKRRRESFAIENVWNTRRLFLVLFAWRPLPSDNVFQLT